MRDNDGAMTYARSIWSIIHFRTFYTLNGASLYLGEFTLEDKVSDIFTRGLLMPTCQVLDGNGDVADLQANLFLLYAPCKVIRVTEARLKKATSHDLQRAPSSLRFFPMSALYLEIPTFMHELQCRMTEAGLQFDYEFVNEHHIPLSRKYHSISKFLRETKSSRLQIRLMTLHKLYSGQSAISAPSATDTFTHTRNAHDSPHASHTESPQITSPESRHTSRVERSPQEIIENALRKSRGMSIELRDGLNLTLSKELFSASSTGLVPSPEVREALEEFLSSAFPSKTGAETTPSSDPARHLQTALRGMSSEELSNVILETLDETGRSMVLRLAMQNSLLRQENTALQARSWFMTRLADEFRLWQGRLSRFIRIGIAVAQQELAMVFFYSLSWMVLINMTGPDMLLIKAAIGIYLGINVFMSILKLKYGIDLIDAVVEHALPKLYLENPAARIPEESLQEVAFQLREEREVNYNVLLDSLVQRPSFGQTVSISVFAAIPSILNKWHKATENQRKEAKAAIVAAAEDINAKRKQSNETIAHSSPPSDVA